MQAACVWSAAVWWILLVTCPHLPDGWTNESSQHPSHEDQGEDVVVSTVEGRLRGRVERVTDDNIRVYLFLGVPYAKPPLGYLRFRATVPHEPWTGVRNATEHGAHCEQNIPRGRQFFHAIPLFMPHDRISEDCLFLNVYTPSIDTSAGLAVLFFIHGGGLFSGSGAQFDGRGLAALGNIVVVTINYRLDALGFLAPGNVGFLDQIAALRWVQDNIHFFGGDHEQVTIAGQSAGGASVALLVLSPLTTGLFRRAISESGVAATMPASHDTSIHVFLSVSGLCQHCTTLTPLEKLECLRNVSLEELIKVPPLTAWNRPVVDGFFLPDHPTTLLQRGPGKGVDYLLGVTNHELGYIVWQDGLASYDMFDGSKDAIRQILHVYFSDYFQCGEAINQSLPLPLEGDELRDFISDSVLDLYMAHQDPLHEIVGDIVMTAPTVNTAMYTANNTVYLYEFQHRPSWHHNKPDHVRADHGDELLFVFGAPFFDWPRNPEDPSWRLNFTEEEKVLSRRVLTYWTNFVKTGDPNRRDLESADTLDLPVWPRFYREDQEYLQLDLHISSAQRLKEQKVKLINEMLTCASSGAQPDRTWTISTICFSIYICIGQLV